MKIVEPVTIGDSNYTASNIVESLPLASSGTTYNKWATGTSYSIGNVVSHDYWTGHVGGGVQRFGVFTCTTASTGVEPNPTDNPSFWTFNSSADKYDASTTYGIGQIIGYNDTSTGAYYYSKVASNTGNTPPTSGTQWQQTSPDGYNTYAGGTTYALGAQVVVFTGQLAQIYESLQNSNTGHTPASSPTWWEYLGSTWKPWASATAYVIGNTVIDLRTHHTYAALASSTNKDPTDTDNAAYWNDLGTNNKWALFDLSNNSATTSPATIEFTVQLPSSCDTMALLNLLATQVVITASTTIGGTLYSQTIDLGDQNDASAARLYYHDTVTKESHLIITELPTDADLIVSVVITNSGTSSQCGVALFGVFDEIGGAQYGATMGILSFSRKEADGFGNYTLLQRPSSLRPKFTVSVDSTNGNADRIFFKLKRLDAVPALYIGADSRAATWVFGFYRSFEELLNYPETSYYSLEIEGLG